MTDTPFDFHIYIYGLSAQSSEMISWFTEACAQVIPTDQFQINVVDIAIFPLQAEKDKILAIPTILRQSPKPHKRVVGRMDQAQALQAVHLLTEL